MNDIFQILLKGFTTTGLVCEPDLTAALYGISDVLEDFYLNGKLPRTESFVNINPAGSRHLRSVSYGSRMNSYSNEELPTF
ncbi:hypothetical protein TNCV_1171281 [Trichonephila clavipes]|nr:hypothetical protein TNCV_1171281 [Trichonephila clavipes]